MWREALVILEHDPAPSLLVAMVDGSAVEQHRPLLWPNE